jgi:site-specific recombinase XerD
LCVSSVKYIVAKYVKKAGIRKKVSVHTLRHTFGAHKADKQMGIATLQELMGHKKKETTLKYRLMCSQSAVTARHGTSDESDRA